MPKHGANVHAAESLKGQGFNGAVASTGKFDDEVKACFDTTQLVAGQLLIYCSQRQDAAATSWCDETEETLWFTTVRKRDLDEVVRRDATR